MLSFADHLVGHAIDLVDGSTGTQNPLAAMSCRFESYHRYQWMSRLRAAYFLVRNYLFGPQFRSRHAAIGLRPLQPILTPTSSHPSLDPLHRLALARRVIRTQRIGAAIEQDLHAASGARPDFQDRRCASRMPVMQHIRIAVGMSLEGHEPRLPQGHLTDKEKGALSGASG